jgi:hypothetical protein
LQGFFQGQHWLWEPFPPLEPCLQHVEKNFSVGNVNKNSNNKIKTIYKDEPIIDEMRMVSWSAMFNFWTTVPADI